jgi:putative DNA methylase
MTGHEEGARRGRLGTAASRRRGPRHPLQRFSGATAQGASATRHRRAEESGSADGGGTPPLQSPPPLEHKGWYVPRGLPHLDAPGIVQAITFRLADALPHDVIAAKRGDGAHRRRIAAALDAGHGACVMREPTLAGIVESALLHDAGHRYELMAWVIMPNHVHVLIAPAANGALSAIVHMWKSWTAKAINRERNGGGTIWQRDYFDRFVRDDRHLAATIAYIEGNPVKAGLIGSAADWRFSSAWRGRASHAL